MDESGDHGLESCDPSYPVFVLAFCVMEKRKYLDQIVPRIQEFKFKYFGHDMVVLHEHEIRKARGAFSFLTNSKIRLQFMADLNQIVIDVPFVVIAVAIQKEQLMSRYTKPSNPYHIAIQFGLERVDKYLRSMGQHDKRTFVVFESRGKKEDNELELEFRRVCDGANYRSGQFQFDIILARKTVNSSGLQLADLIARPIGRHIMNPAQENRAFAIIETKLDRSPQGGIEGWGLKCFP